MDCLDAQRTVSEKLDRAAVDQRTLEAAKDHCRLCPDCSLFVRALLNAGDASLPVPPEGLEDRIIAAVRREAAIPSSAEPSAASQKRGSLESVGVVGSKARMKKAFNDPRNQNTILAWTAAAALIFVAAGIGAIIGVRQIFAPPPSTMMLMDSTTEESWSVSDAIPEANLKSVEPESFSTSVATSTPGPSYITVSETVYRAAGPAVGIDPAALKPLGSTTTARDTQNAPSSVQVLALDDPARVYVADGTGGHLGFDRVTRTYGGRVYALKSGEIASYGQWPSLPSTVTRPQSADGSPNYQPLGPDSLGVTVFGLGGSASQGILVAPGTPANDPAAGNPDWTWWGPIQ